MKLYCNGIITIAIVTFYWRHENEMRIKLDEDKIDLVTVCQF